jgi:hypothetical protein
VQVESQSEQQFLFARPLVTALGYGMVALYPPGTALLLATGAVSSGLAAIIAGGAIVSLILTALFTRMMHRARKRLETEGMLPPLTARKAAFVGYAVFTAVLLIGSLVSVVFAILGVAGFAAIIFYVRREAQTAARPTAPPGQILSATLRAHLNSMAATLAALNKYA